MYGFRIVEVVLFNQHLLQSVEFVAIVYDLRFVIFMLQSYLLCMPKDGIR